MYRQLLEHSSLLIFPLIALVLFLTTFIAQVVLTFARRKESYDGAAALPLTRDDS
jgi:hypothetical protein